MPKFVFLVEGKSDIGFLRDYLNYLYEDFQITKDKAKEKVLEFNDTRIKIIAVGGYTAISNRLTTLLQEIKDFDNRLIIIQDADTTGIEKGGFKNRTEYLNKIKGDLNIDFETFLFPNNKDDGDLETLLLQLVDSKKYTASYNCYEKYAQCTGSITEKDYSSELLERKNKVFNYFRTYNGMELAKEENRSFDQEYWDFSNDALLSFQSFISKILAEISISVNS